MAGYDIVRADLADDRERILATWKRNLGAHDEKEHEVRYDWIGRCPLGPPRIWLALHQGEVVGTACLMMRRVWLDGAAHNAGVAGDFAVDARHRMLQPALSLQKAVLGAREDGVDVVYGLPNKNAIKVFERIGYKVAGPMARYVKVLRTGKFFRSSGKRWLRAAAPLAPLADLALKLRSADTWRRPAAGRVLEPVRRFDARFDALWDRIAPGATMMGVRTADFLNWRYADCPLQSYQTLALAEGTGGRVAGYITWYTPEDRQARVADWVFDASPGAAEDLLAGMVRRARKDGAASVSCEHYGADALTPILGRFGFVSRDSNATLTVAAKPALAEGFEQKYKAWYFLRGDENVNTL